MQDKRSTMSVLSTQNMNFKHFGRWLEDPDEKARNERELRKRWDLLPTGKKQSVHTVLPNKIFKGQRCIIIGGGTSVNAFREKYNLENEFIIAVNKAFIDFDCEFVISMDSRFYQWVIQGQLGQRAVKRWVDFKGYKVFIDPFNYAYKDVYYVKGIGKIGVSMDLEKGVYHGSNSGYGAINFALALGFSPIYLIGFDMNPNGKMHYHEGYPTYVPNQKLHNFKENINMIPQHMNGGEVINLNQKSHLKCFPFGDLPKKKKEKFKLITFFTYGNGYEDVFAKKFKASAEALEMEYEFEAIPDRGSWRKNVYYKAEFIKKMLHQEKCNLVFVDCDGMIQQYPKLFDHFPFDIGCHMRDGKELLSGTMFLRNNARVKKLVNQWMKRNNEKIAERWAEQINLKEVIDESEDIKFQNIPASYCQIFDTMRTYKKPVIEHFQESRGRGRQK